MSDISKINLSSLKMFKHNFTNEKDNFNSSAYATFSSSYLSSSNDTTVSTMRNQLDEIYKKIVLFIKKINTRKELDN